VSRPEPLPRDAADRRRLGRQLAVDGLVASALTGSEAGRTAAAAPDAAAGSMASRLRTRRRRGMGLFWPAACAAAAACALAVFWHFGTDAGPRPLDGDIRTEDGQTAASLSTGQWYRAGSEGARLSAPGGGSIEISGETVFAPLQRGVMLRSGEVTGRELASAELRAGPLAARAAAPGTSVLLARPAGAEPDEAAVAVLSGRALAGRGTPGASLSAGHVLACGWGVEPRPFAAGELRALIEERRGALAGRGECDRYQGILGEYAASVERMRRELQGLPPGTPEAEAMESRIASLTECAAAHQRRVPQLKADAAEHARIDRREAFLDRVIRESRTGQPTATAAVHGPESPACGVLMASTSP